MTVRGVVVGGSGEVGAEVTRNIGIRVTLSEKGKRNGRPAEGKEPVLYASHNTDSPDPGIQIIQQTNNPEEMKRLEGLRGTGDKGHIKNGDGAQAQIGKLNPTGTEQTSVECESD